MKIRHKCGYGYFEVVEESPRYYLVHASGIRIFDWPKTPITYGDLLALPKSEYEPVPESSWRNVTGEVEIAGNGLLSHRIRPNSTRALFPNEVMNGYRFVKQSLWMALPDRFTRDTWIEKTEEQNMKDRFVLTVEYKESV